MFMADLQSIMRQKAKKIHFEANGYAISKDLLELYENLKISFTSIVNQYDSQLDYSNCIDICIEMVRLYSIAQEILQNLLTECFRDSFYLNLEKMGSFFEFLDKICKLLIAVDLIKIQNPIVFSKYCEAKLKEIEEFNLKIDELEDNKICILHMITLPYGRMFLSFFCHPIFDLNRPSYLDKNIKVYLNHDSVKRLSLFVYLIERNRWKYVLVYFLALFYKLTHNDPFGITDNELMKYKKYLNMLKMHN